MRLAIMKKLEDIYRMAASPQTEPSTAVESKPRYTRADIEAMVRAAQEEVRQVIPSSVSLVDELIADRRAEAGRE
jgi:hypothetical protein